MRLKEQRLWDSMKRHAPKGFILERIENVVKAGTPDVIVRFPGKPWRWVELKSPASPKRADTRLLGSEGLNKDQMNWHIKAALSGGDNYVLIRDSDRNLYLIDCARLGIGVQLLNDMDSAQLRNWSVAEDWHEIFEELAK